MRKTIPIIIAAVMLTGCVRSISQINDGGTWPAAQAPAPGLAPQEVTLLAEPTQTAAPAVTPSPTPAWSGTPDLRFGQAEVIEVGYLDIGFSIMVIDVKARVPGEYVGVIAGMEEPYPCTRLDQYPERLYCSGPQVELGAVVLFVLYPAEGGEAVFGADVDTDLFIR